MKPYTIRRYTLDDLDELWSIAQKFTMADREGVANHFKPVELDKEKLYNIYKMNVRNIRFFTNLVIDGDGKIIGLLAAQVEQYYFSSDTLAADMCFYFDENATNIRALIDLVNSYVEWAKRRNVREVQLRTSTTYKQEKFGALMKRLGFIQFETGYSMEI